MTWQDEINAPVNAQGEYAAKKFYGDPKLAAAYLPVAYALLGGVKNQMTLSGIGYGHRMVELKDGTRIRVIRNGEQNIVEIDVSAMGGNKTLWVRLFGYTFYPRNSSYPSGFIRPITEDEPYGTRAKTPWTLIETDGYISRIQLEYPPKKDIPAISVVRATKSLSGNQFEFDGFDVYSWWGSPCGDGPLAVYKIPDDIPSVLYRPFKMFGTLLCYLYPGCDAYPVPPRCPTYLCRNGSFFADFGKEIAGVKVFTQEILGVRSKRGIVILRAGTSVTLAEFNINDGAIKYGPIPLCNSADLVEEDDHAVEMVWPWRMSDNGENASTIVREYTADKIPVAYALSVVTATLSYTKNGVTVSGLSVTRHKRTVHRTRTTSFTHKQGEFISGYLGGTSERTESSLTFSGVFGWEDYTISDQYRVNYTGVGSFNIPFAVNYKGTELVVCLFNGSYSMSEVETRDYNTENNTRENASKQFSLYKKENGTEAWTGSYISTISGGEESLAEWRIDRTKNLNYHCSLLNFSFENNSTYKSEYIDQIKHQGGFSYATTFSGAWDEPGTYTGETNFTYTIPKDSTWIYETDEHTDYRKWYIAYVDLKADAFVAYVNGQIEHVYGKTTKIGSIPIVHDRSFQIYNIPSGFASIESVLFSDGGYTQGNGDFTVTGNSRKRTVSNEDALKFYAYQKEAQQYDHSFDGDSEIIPGVGYIPGGLFELGANSYTHTTVDEYIEPDPTNQWVDVQGRSISIAADYHRPVILKKPPSYVAEIVVPGYSKQTSTFGDPADFIEDKPVLFPIGLY